MNRTPKEAKDYIRQELRLSVAEWARQNGYTPRQVQGVLSGEAQCLFGKSRTIAKKLGMKVPDVE
jgi:gp16 family phage-associated protein